jgi:hypothetical protein
MAKPDQLSAAVQAWDVEYDTGRYREEPPLPLVTGGLDLIGLDISATAIDEGRLTAREGADLAQVWGHDQIGRETSDQVSARA